MAILRPYVPADLGALFDISLATGNAGSDASHLYVDKQLVGLIYSAPYAALMPHLVLVVEDGEGVAGFALGALNTTIWERMLEKTWWPALRLRYPDPLSALRRTWNADERRAHLIHHPEHAPDEVKDPYPAHLHLNLLPRVQRRGIGFALLSAWLQEARVNGALGVHVAVNRSNLTGMRFWEKNGFADVRISSPTASRTSWLGRTLHEF